MKKAKVQTGVRFNPEMLSKINYIAKLNMRSMNAQIEYIVQQCIDEYEYANGKIVLKSSDKKQ